MRWIAHRGNTKGRQPERENTLPYLQAALDEGFDVELDLRVKDGTLWLGHDRPDHRTTAEWLRERADRLWVHCKDLDALAWALQTGLPHAFFHDQDDHTLTTCRRIWTYPDRPVTPDSILVLVAQDPPPPQPVFGICSDYVALWADEARVAV